MSTLTREIWFPFLLVFVPSRASGSIRLRLASMALLSVTKLILWLVDSNRSRGRDYDEPFTPVAHMTTVRTLLAVASVRNWSVSQLDV